MDRHWWYRGRRAAVDGLLRRVGVPRAKPKGAAPAGRGPARVLDYGCGVGNMGVVLARFGDVWGVDADAESLAAGSFSHYRGVTRAAAVGEVSAPPGGFDVVTCLDVLEHVEDDAGAVDGLAELLGPGGVLVVSVPLHPELFCEVDEIAGHRRRYTVDEVERLVRGAGLEIVARSGYVVGLLPVARRHRRRVLQGKAAPSREWAVPPAPVNALLTGVSFIEGRLIRWVSLPAGLSLLVAARRRDGAGRAEGGGPRSG